ncbi:MAG: hypothetical protein QOE70_4022 [Chthoniobacter sp.]|jgi:hypothetical protein|nr:hypothetical protein [Chthoniobacter sp.]
MIPTVGRTVLYVMPTGHLHAGEIRPAVVVRAWAKTPDASLNLNVFIDPANDAPLVGNDQCSVVFDPTGIAPRSWHWPPRANGVGFTPDAAVNGAN